MSAISSGHNSPIYSAAQPEQHGTSDNSNLFNNNLLARDNAMVEEEFTCYLLSGTIASEQSSTIELVDFWQEGSLNHEWAFN